MSDFLYLRNKIEEEGFHYCFNGYSTWTSVKDPKFQELRKAYLKAHKELDKYIDKKADKEAKAERGEQ